MLLRYGLSCLQLWHVHAGAGHPGVPLQRMQEHPSHLQEGLAGEELAWSFVYGGYAQAAAVACAALLEG
jgi:hypothetical protein